MLRHLLPTLYRTYPGLTWDDIETMPRAELTLLLDDLALTMNRG